MKKTLKALWKELIVYKWVLISTVLLGAFSSGLKALTPELLKRLVEAWEAKDSTLTYTIPLIVTAVWILSAGAKYLHMYWIKYTAERVTVKLRKRLMVKYLSLNVGFVQGLEKGSGGLISRMLNDISVIQMGIGKVADFIREPFMALFTLSYLIYIDANLLLFIVVALPIITLIQRNLARSIRKYSSRNLECMDDLTKTLKESLDGRRVVQAYNLEGEMESRFKVQAEAYLQTRKKIISREEASSPSSESLTAIAQAGLMMYIGYLVLGREFSTAEFLGFMFAVGLFQDSIKKIQSSYIQLQQASVALTRIQKILDEEDEVMTTKSPVSFPTDWKQIEFKNISHVFDSTKVLDGINFSVNRGELVAIVGASGSGKSTLMNLLERFFDPSEGEILIGDIPIGQFDRVHLRDNIGLVTQNVFLFSGSIEYNIQLGDLDKPKEFVVEAAKLANAHDFILSTPGGYQSEVGEAGDLFSGGEKQRISIARTIFKNAPILILDEATSALDSKSELEVQRGLDKLLHNKTAFVIAHRLSTIMRADRIFVLKDGKLVEQGSHEELIGQKGEYFNFYQIQSKI